MKLTDAVVVVTGGGSGIGKALCRRFAKDGAKAVVVVDIASTAHDVAAEIGGVAFPADVAKEPDVRRVVQEVLALYGRIDLFCSNAGISGGGGLDTTDADWQRMWQVNTMAHIYAARAVVPPMIEAGGGYLLQTASAAGLLTQIGSAPYSVTKHAAVAFAEWLSVTYGDRGIKVSCLCPEGVRTPMFDRASATARAVLDQGAIEPEEVADAVVAGLAEERFLILPHARVGEFFKRKADDYDRWLRGMRRLRERSAGQSG